MFFIKSFTLNLLHFATSYWINDRNPTVGSNLVPLCIDRAPNGNWHENRWHRFWHYDSTANKQNFDSPGADTRLLRPGLGQYELLFQHSADGRRDCRKVCASIGECCGSTVIRHDTTNNLATFRCQAHAKCDGIKWNGDLTSSWGMGWAEYFTYNNGYHNTYNSKDSYSTYFGPDRCRLNFCDVESFVHSYFDGKMSSWQDSQGNWHSDGGWDCDNTRQGSLFIIRNGTNEPCNDNCVEDGWYSSLQYAAIHYKNSYTTHRPMGTSSVSPADIIDAETCRQYCFKFGGSSSAQYGIASCDEVVWHEASKTCKGHTMQTASLYSNSGIEEDRYGGHNRHNPFVKQCRRVAGDGFSSFINLSQCRHRDIKCVDRGRLSSSFARINDTVCAAGEYSMFNLYARNLEECINYCIGNPAKEPYAFDSPYALGFVSTGAPGDLHDGYDYGYHIGEKYSKTKCTAVQMSVDPTADLGYHCVGFGKCFPGDRGTRPGKFVVRNLHTCSAQSCDEMSFDTNMSCSDPPIFELSAQSDLEQYTIVDGQSCAHYCASYNDISNNYRCSVAVWKDGICKGFYQEESDNYHPISWCTNMEDNGATRYVNLHICQPKEASWAEWSNYGECSSAESLCNVGTKTRSRGCNNSYQPYAQSIGKEQICSEAERQYEECRSENCIGSFMEVVDEFALSNGKALETIRLFKQMDIVFEVFPEQSVNSSTNVLFLGENGSYGVAHQSVYMKPNSTLCFANENSNGNIHEEAIPLEAWSQVRLSQLVDSEGELTYQITVNDTKVYESRTIQPVQIDRATVLVAQEPTVNHSGAAPAKMRNLIIVSHDCAAGTYFDGSSCTPGSTFEHPDEFFIDQGNLLHSVRVAKEFELEFDMMLKSVVPNMTNLLTIGRTSSMFQKTALWITGNPEMFSVTHASFMCNVTGAIEIDEWKNIKVRQYPSLDSTSYIFKFLIDGATVCEYENQEAAELPMADLLFSDSESDPAQAVVKNVRFKSQHCPIGQSFDGTRCKVQPAGRRIVMKSEFNITQNNLLDSIKVGNQYELDFDVLPRATSPDLANILRIGRGQDMESYGDRNPAIWFVPGTTSLRIANSMNGEQHFYETEPISLDTWTNVRVTQLRQKQSRRRRSDGDIYLYTITVAGEHVFSEENTQPIEMENAQVWMSDNFSPAANVMLRNVQFVTHDCPTGSQFDGVECKEFPCPSTECWSYDALEHTCSLISGNHSSCEVQLECNANSIVFTFPTLLFNTNDTTLFGEEQGCEPTFDEQSRKLQWESQVGQCGQTFEKIGELLVFRKVMSLNATMTENDDELGIFFGGSKEGSFVALSCTYSSHTKASERNVTIVPQSYNVEGELSGVGDFSDALVLNFYATGNFEQIINAEEIFTGQTVFAGVQWNIDEPVDGLRFFLANCSIVTAVESTSQYGYDSTPQEQSVAIVKDTCYANVVNARPIGPKISTTLPKFTYTAFLYNTKWEQFQHLECYVTFCLVEECSGLVASANEQCPVNEMQYTFDGY